MIDLPQHAAQITLWKFYGDPCYRFDRVVEQNWFTPYLLGYAITRLFAFILPVNGALKAVVFLAIVALPLSMLSLTRRAGVDDWLALVGFPLAFGFSFYWGFLNFLASIPLAIVFVALAYDYMGRRTLVRGVLLTFIAALLVISHALVFVGAAAAAGAMHLFLWRTPRQMIAAALPYVMPIPALLWWVHRMRSHEARVNIPPMWGLGSDRLLQFPSDLLSAAYERAAFFYAIALALIVVVCGVRFTRDARRWMPAIVFGLMYFFLPQSVFGTAFVNQRFAVLCAATIPLALERRASLVRPSLVRPLIVIAAFGWLAILSARFYRFGIEADSFDRLVDHLPTNRGVLLLNAEPRSEFVGGPMYLHYSAYYQARKGGTIGWSFASNFPVLMHYRPGADPMTTPGLGWDPRLFRWNSPDSHFDYFVIRAPLDLGAPAFRRASEPIILAGRWGMWWLYQRQRQPPIRPVCPPLVPDGDAARRPLLVSGTWP